jgi:hypothetical protein
MGKRTIKSLKALVDDDIRKICSARLKDDMSVEILRALIDYIVSRLYDRIDDIKYPDGKTISLYSDKREFLTINLMRVGFRIYIHPAANVFFDPKSKFKVAKFRFWDASFQKSSGKYRGMSVWIEDKKYLPGVKEIIDKIPSSNNV